jgi:membrane protein DedA with SNARE-associated domain
MVPEPSPHPVRTAPRRGPPRRAARLGARRLTRAADTVEPMSLLAAASSDQGGITGWLLDLVDKLGAVGVGLTIFIETVIPPIPSEAVLGLAGANINAGRMSVVPVIFFATLGSVAGAAFFYAIGSALGPRRSHAFLDRLPLVETEDVDRTFEWFEKHGRSAVFFGRMVPIIRSFVSVPAGVVKMPFLQFIVYTAGGSLIWNSVLIGLGVAAGDFIEKNLHYLDYAVVAAAVLAVAWMVYRRIRDVYKRRGSASRAPVPESAPLPESDGDRPAA